MAHLVSVNVGLPRAAEWAGIGRTSMDKRAVTGPVMVRRLGIEGDQVSNTKFHGGPDQAVYAFAQEDLDFWAAELQAEVLPGQFAENLTTSGIDVNEAEIGSRWQIGEVLLEIASIRTPCNTFKAWQHHTGYDAAGWVKRFAQVGRPGPYFRVIGEGHLQAGDEITVVHEPGHGVSVSTMFKALNTDRSLLPLLLDVPDLIPQAREMAEAYVAQQSDPPTR